jgi:hypothetical protein
MLFTQSKSNPSREDLRFWEIMASVSYFFGIIAIGIYALAHDSLRIFGLLWMVGAAAWLVGTALGFLFGVPRVRASEVEDRPDTAVVPNTNLEQISDWLTKIIVGATLVQLGPIARGVAILSGFVGGGLGTNHDEGAAMSGAVMVFYFAAGFVWGYLWCSLRVFREMQALVQRERQVETRTVAE